MSLPLVTILVVVLCQFGFIAIFAFRKRPADQTTERKRDAAARNGILLESIAYAVVWMTGRGQNTTIVPMSFPVQIAVSAFAIGLAVISVWFVHQAVRVLGKQWAYAARVVEGHQLITHGPYGIVRHPIYSGMFGLLIAVGLAHSRWWAFLFGVILFLIGTMIRIRSEEKLLRETFGAEFDAYARRVKAVVPGVV